MAEPEEGSTLLRSERVRVTYRCPSPRRGEEAGAAG